MGIEEQLNQLERECHFKILRRQVLQGFGQAGTRSVGGMRIRPVNLRIEGRKFEPAILLHSISAHERKHAEGFAQLVGLERSDDESYIHFPIGHCRRDRSPLACGPMKNPLDVVVFDCAEDPGQPLFVEDSIEGAR